MVKEKNIIVSILLSICTCGIYSLYWLCCVNDDVDVISQNPNRRSAGMVVFLTIITCGIYGFYWWYVNGQLMEQANQRSNKASNSNAILFLILAIFGLNMVNYILIQADINKYAYKN